MKTISLTLNVKQRIALAGVLGSTQPAGLVQMGLQYDMWKKIVLEPEDQKRIKFEIPADGKGVKWDETIAAEIEDVVVELTNQESKHLSKVLEQRASEMTTADWSWLGPIVEALR